MPRRTRNLEYHDLIIMIRDALEHGEIAEYLRETDGPKLEQARRSSDNKFILEFANGQEFALTITEREKSTA